MRQIIQKTEENSDLRSELDVRKKEHKNMIQWVRNYHSTFIYAYLSNYIPA